jgi:thioredoxin reductase (NADPH)
LKGEHVYIVGGGNSAGQAAMHFVSTAKRISIVIREDSLTQTLSKYLIDRIQAAPSVEVLPQTEVTGRKSVSRPQRDEFAKLQDRFGS